MQKRWKSKTKDNKTDGKMTILSKCQKNSGFCNRQLSSNGRLRGRAGIMSIKQLSPILKRKKALGVDKISAELFKADINFSIIKVQASLMWCGSKKRCLRSRAKD